MKFYMHKTFVLKHFCAFVKIVFIAVVCKKIFYSFDIYLFVAVTLLNTVIYRLYSNLKRCKFLSQGHNSECCFLYSGDKFVIIAIVYEKR